jgi:hypothetical protein
MAYSKTERGLQEIESRSHGLTSRARRLLIMIDGVKGEAELEAFARPGELAATLEELLQGGFISAGGVASSTASPAPPTGPAVPSSRPVSAVSLTPEQFKAIRLAASHFLYDRMGPASDFACEKIEACQTPQELRAKLREIEVMVGQVLGPRVAQEFARAFGQRLL